MPRTSATRREYLLLAGLWATVFTLAALLQFTGWNEQARAAGTQILLSDFESATPGLSTSPENPLNGYFYGYDDSSRNGGSTLNELQGAKSGSPISPQADPGQGANGSDGYLRITGKVTEDFDWGYAGAGLWFFQDHRAFDLSDYRGIRFSVRGDGTEYRIKIHFPGLRYGHHEITFTPGPKWSRYSFNFKDFAQPSWMDNTIELEQALKKATGFLWQTSTQPLEKFELNIDDIELYRTNIIMR